MSVDAQIRDALITVSDTDVDLERLLRKVQRRATNNRRRRLLVAGATCVALLLAAGTLAVLGDGSDGRGPAVSLQPADPTEAPAPLPTFLPDTAMTIDRIDLGGPFPTPQPPMYAQIFAASPTLEGPRLAIVMIQLPAPAEPLFCGPTSNGLSPSGQAVNPGTPITIGDHSACLYTTLPEPQISWLDSNTLEVTVLASGLTRDDVIQVAKSIVLRSDHADGVTLNAPPPAGLSEVMSGASPTNTPTTVSFHQGACMYSLQFGASNPSRFGPSGTPTSVNSQPALLGGNALAWNPVEGSTASMIVNEAGVYNATTAAADCDLVGVASRITQVDGPTWSQTLANLDDKVHQPDQATTTTPAPAPLSNSPEPQYNGEEATIANVFKTWISGPGVDATVPLLEDGEALRGALSQPAPALSAQPHSARIDAAHLVDNTHADVTFSILDQNGNAVLPNQQGAAVKIDGTWRVSRDTYCALVAKGGIQCPPSTP